MPKKMEFARGVDDSTGAEKKKPKVVYSAEVQRKLDDVLAVAKKAETDDERISALAEYKKKIKEVGEEQTGRMKSVDFRGEKIHNFELQALKKIVLQINEDYAGQRLAGKSFGLEDVKIDDLKIEIENEKVVGINLEEKMLMKIPAAVGELTNLQDLGLLKNQITKISGLDNLTNLQTLWLSENRITEISGLDNLTNLQELGLGRNRITEISGLDNLTNLQTLGLNDNRITEISGLDNLTDLRWLLLNNNQITEISGLDNLTNLQRLWISDNQIDTTDEKIKEQIKALKGRKVAVEI